VLDEMTTRLPCTERAPPLPMRVHSPLPPP
jgi:hypothetical protein